MRLILLLFAFALLSTASAQRCVSELEAAAERLPAGTPTGVLAAELLADAVRWVEPTLPPLVWSPEVPLAPGEAGYDSVRYLAERSLLSHDWQADKLTAESWQSMLNGFRAWYGLPSLRVSEQPGSEQLVSDLASALEEVAGSVRPLALVAADSNDSSEIAFLALVWNWTIYPRLIVLRPDPEQTLDAGVRPLLDELGNCAVEVEHYVYAPEETARSLFLTHADARMYVIGSEPELQAWPLLVPEGQEDEYFSFSAPVVSGLIAYAAAFDGGRLGLRSLLAMLPRLRTNLPPTRLPGLLSTPVAP